MYCYENLSEIFEKKWIKFGAEKKQDTRDGKEEEKKEKEGIHEVVRIFGVYFLSTTYLTARHVSFDRQELRQELSSRHPCSNKK